LRESFLRLRLDTHTNISLSKRIRVGMLDWGRTQCSATVFNMVEHKNRNVQLVFASWYYVTFREIPQVGWKVLSWEDKQAC
jgi:hypothetical protein